MLTAINHIGIAVRDLEQSKHLYSTLFGVQAFHEETVESQKVKVASFALNGVLIELTAPLDAESPIARFLEKKGEGIHHIAFTSTEIQQDLNHFAEAGIQLINPTAQPGAHDMQIAFMHPRSTGGVLMEICQPSASAHIDSSLSSPVH
jgi:methylmalonyl-CoA/ethylmalonyl-CoA epimerase